MADPALKNNMNEKFFIKPYLQSLINANGKAIEDWFLDHSAKSAPFYYSSVDLRHSGFKLAPVDTNLFPAGFNNLSPDAFIKAIQGTKKYFAEHYPRTKKVLLLPEENTRNLYYLDNVAALQNIFSSAGFEVKIGALNFEQITPLISGNGTALIFEPLVREEDQIKTTASNFVPDAIVINNDLTTGAPPLLREIKQPIIPPVGYGWYRRQKSRHFETYNQLIQRFADTFKLDSWLISTFYHQCGMVDFKEKQGIDCVAMGAEKVLHRIRQKYVEYHITETPYVFVKANRGTYGMGIMTVRSGEELYEINKKTRNKMDVIKGGAHNTEVVIQEGIPSVDTIDGIVAEPMIYLIGGKPIGCSYRINSNRDAYGNLNSPGMSFENACDSDEEKKGDHDSSCPVLGLVAKLASLAATRECYEAGWEI